MQFISIIAFIILIEIILAFLRIIRRKYEFNKAKTLSKKLGRSLLVIGDPDNGGVNSIFGRSYGCGDLCIDIVGCNKCMKSIKGNALHILKQLPDNSYVIYESCVLEYINTIEIPSIIKEIKRVSGNHYFNVRVGPSLTHLYYWPSLWTGETHKSQYISHY